MEIHGFQSCTRFGIARADITPPVGMYHRMWGAAMHDVSEGVHRPLLATVLYFAEPEEDRSEETEQLVFAIDHCLFSASEVELMITHISEMTGVAKDAIVLTFSHTHAAGLILRERADQPGGKLIGPYLDELTQTLGALGISAIESAVYCDIMYGRGRCGLAANRDLYVEELDEYVCGFNPAVKADDAVVVGRAITKSGEVVATFVNYACHPTTLAWQNRLISPDYVGAMREVVEQATGAPCVFLQGASGDLGPMEGFVGDPDVADRHGRRLGYAALSALESLPRPNTKYVFQKKVVSGASIGVWHHVPEDGYQLETIAYWGVIRRTIKMPFRDDLPTLEETEKRHAELLSESQEAAGRGDTARTQELRALLERTTRMIERLRALPTDGTCRITVTVLQMGEASWIFVPGEPYSELQTRLRSEFPDRLLIISTLANGWGPSYMPTRDTYGKGIYQESIAAMGPGALEHLTTEIGHIVAEHLYG